MRTSVYRQTTITNNKDTIKCDFDGVFYFITGCSAYPSYKHSFKDFSLEHCPGIAIEAADFAAANSVCVGVTDTALINAKKKKKTDYTHKGHHQLACASKNVVSIFISNIYL